MELSDLIPSWLKRRKVTDNAHRTDLRNGKEAYLQKFNLERDVPLFGGDAGQLSDDGAYIVHPVTGKPTIINIPNKAQIVKK